MDELWWTLLVVRGQLICLGTHEDWRFVCVCVCVSLYCRGTFVGVWHIKCVV